ncbi:hypothetical protein Dda_0217 [Drechslerella dactyloides]|uniref:Uncharacterized protein n=1 Tax=Drechslerella dactyloides TaxID=74499 RepID=A0AAD6J7M4_DREDA|nr:hypothetical protein Dda_0217 [Drechslerella dactyloides]
MYANVYNGNVIANRNSVHPPSGINGTDNTTILVRLAPDAVTIDIPFNRVTTWKRLIQTLFEIYKRNNPRAGYLCLDDALDCIQIRNDLTGGLILPELWSDFIKPQVRISAHFYPPFLSPPWDPSCATSIKQEDDDIDMMEGVVTYAIETKLGGLIESAISTSGWSKPSARLLGPAYAKQEESEAFHLLTAPLNAPLSPFSFTGCASAWAPLEPEKSRARAPVAISRPTATAIISGGGEPMLLSATIPSEPLADPMRDMSESPQPCIVFRDPFSQQTAFSGSGSSRITPPAMPQRFSPVRNVPAMSDPQNSRPASRSPISPEATNQSAGLPRDANPRPTKRKREEKAPMAESSRKSKSPFPSSESNENISRGASADIAEQNTSPKCPAAASAGARKVGEINLGKSVVIHSKILLLDSINAGEMIKVIRTNDGDFIAIRDDEEPEDIMERRRRANIPQKKDKDTEASKNAKKRALDEAQTEELIRIWSGGGPEPPAKASNTYNKPKANVYDKLTVDHKHCIAKFVHEQHIIRVDHFTGPVIQEWKARTIPDADVKQTEEYIEEIAAGKYNDTAKRKEAYRLFMEHHNHCHKATRPSPSPTPKA